MDFNILRSLKLCAALALFSLSVSALNDQELGGNCQTSIDCKGNTSENLPGTACCNGICQTKTKQALGDNYYCPAPPVRFDFGFPRR